MGELTVKFISQVSRVGSDAQTATRLRTLSKAAGKFNFNLGVSIREKAKNVKAGAQGATQANQGQGAVTPPRKNSTLVQTTTINCSREDAARIATHLANMMANDGNSDKYVSRKAAFDTEKARTLAEFGVKGYDDLTEDQRQEYAKRMIAKKAPFVYTEQSIHIKYEGCVTVYTQSRRRLGIAHWPADSFNKNVDLDKLRQKYDVIVKPVHPTSPASSSSALGVKGLNLIEPDDVN